MGSSAWCDELRSSSPCEVRNGQHRRTSRELVSAVTCGIAAGPDSDTPYVRRTPGTAFA